jgi:geranylgeranyl pyrophosphate synthase
MTNPPYPEDIEVALDDVRALMGRALADTVLPRILPDTRVLLANGKMLRSRLALRVGPFARAPYATVLHASAAVELIHAASLLHDDVIDGGYLRRNLPTFWVEKGVPGAILVGDLMLFKALDLLLNVEEGRLIQSLVKVSGEICDAESEQELVLRGQPAVWENCVRIARRKTGALFAFAAFAAAGPDPLLAATLREAGYLAGTAYQLADDILDVSGDEALAGKTLGTDVARVKTTAASAAAGSAVDPAAYVDSLCAQAEDSLADWSQVKHAWRQFMSHDLRPALNKSLASAVQPAT